jgi:hypothetical protein
LRTKNNNDSKENKKEKEFVVKFDSSIFLEDIRNDSVGHSATIVVPCCSVLEFALLVVSREALSEQPSQENHLQKSLWQMMRKKKKKRERNTKDTDDDVWSHEGGKAEAERDENIPKVVGVTGEFPPT